MPMPNELVSAIECLSNHYSTHDLKKARERLTLRYRNKAGNEFMKNDLERLSYLITRLPATFSALQAVFKQIPEELRTKVSSMLDVGAGPGTGGWAACEYFPLIQFIAFLEQDESIMQMGIELAKKSSYTALKNGKWIKKDIQMTENFPRNDLVLCSYSMGELKLDQVIPVLEACWGATDCLLVIIEPGTPEGFERILRMRQHLIGLGANMVAPCPHENPCPLEKNDWCHFSARVERTSLHRKLKEGQLGYEDEKFSYIVFSKAKVELPAARILRHPDKHSGHISFILCTKNGIQNEKKSKKQGEEYKKVRKAEWGDFVQ